MGTAVILPDLILPSRVNQQWLYSGMDSLEQCRDQQHFLNYPYTVDYVYNSRGFRDQEWPDNEQELRDAIWCLGDSFTVGIGQPFAHIWPYVLATATGRRCINISMDGASNDWIWRRAQDIRAAIQPPHMVIMWSYTHRRELADASLSDEQRRLGLSQASNEQDLIHWTGLVNKMHTMSLNIVQCTIPEYHSDLTIQSDTIMQAYWHDIKGQDWPAFPRTVAELESLPDWIINELQNLHCCYRMLQHYLLPPVEQATSPIDSDVIHVTKRLDWARDHHHFDILTSQWVVDQIIPRLNA